MKARHNVTGPNLDGDWRVRQRYWARKLGRIRLGAEPVEEQLAKYRRVTLMLTAVPFGVALMFFALFSAFGRPDVGLILSAVLLLPIVTIAWLDFSLLYHRVHAYMHEARNQEQRSNSREA